MANRILTPSNVPNLFGPGKPGFGDDPNPLLATAFDASWCNGIQESVVRTIEAAGLIPDGADFDQFTDAIQSMPLLSPTVATMLTILNGAGLTLEDSSTLLVEADGGNGGSEIRFAGALARAIWDSGSVMQTAIGAIVELLGDVTIGDSSAQTATIDAVANFGADMSLATTQTFTLNGSAKIAGGTSSRVEAGTVALQIGAAAPVADGEFAANSDGVPVFHAGGLRITFGGVNGPWVGEDADQVPETILAATTTLTTVSKVDVNGLLRIRVRGEAQRSAAGSGRISIEQDQGTSTWVAIDNGGVTTKQLTMVSTAAADTWTPFQIERTFGTGVTDTFFRLKVEGLGGQTAKIRDTHLTVRRLGA